MRVTCDDLCKTTDSRACPGVFWQQRRVRMFLVEIFKDSKRLKKDSAVILDQCWNRHHRVDLAELSFPLVTFHQIDFNHLVWRDAFQVQRNADAVGRKRAPE